MINQIYRNRFIYYTLLTFLLIIFTGSLYSISIFFPKDKDTYNENVKKKATFIIPTISITSFFSSCVIVAKLISNGNNPLLPKSIDQYSGIIFLGVCAIILTIMNFTVLQEYKIKDYIKGKKFSTIGALMALGVSAIVFGFLDNFGMKLGTEALDDRFVHMFLGPFSTHKKYHIYKKSISKNLYYMNVWANSNWRSVINQVLRCKDDIIKMSKTQKVDDNRLNDLVDDIIKFINDGAKPLHIPKDLFKIGHGTNTSGGVKEYVKNIKEKYDTIDGSKSMMGNTFSDFVGAILGAAIINLFTFMTSYDGIETGDEKIDSSFLMKYLNKISPFMEAFFISIGCLIPIFLNIAITRDPNSNNNSKSWGVVLFVFALIITMMYYSVKETKVMTTEEKKRSVYKSFSSMIQRLDISEKDKELYDTVQIFMKKIK